MIDATIKYLLQTNGITDTIYRGFLPAEPDTAIVLTLTAGLPPDAKHNYNNAGLQVKTRGTTYPVAETLIFTIFNILQSFSTATVSGTFISDIRAQQDPFSLGRDERDRHLFGQNYTIDYYRDIGHRLD